jgi:hypothetical protein
MQTWVRRSEFRRAEYPEPPDTDVRGCRGVVQYQQHHPLWAADWQGPESSVPGTDALDVLVSLEKEGPPEMAALLFAFGLFWSIPGVLHHLKDYAD